MIHPSGEYIPIFWDSSDHCEVVSGHVSHEVAASVLRREGIYCASFSLRHCWARWVPAKTRSGFDRMYVQLDARARGAFPVTEVTCTCDTPGLDL